MKIGMVGLGRMGGNIVRRLMRHHHSAVVYDRSADAVNVLAGEGALAASGLANLIEQLEAPRIVWVMLPAGEITENTITELGGLLSAGDIIIDGGNSFYRDDIRRAAALQERGIAYVDIGVSGGVWGLERGYCMMLGGPLDAIATLDPIVNALAPGVGSISKTEGREGHDPRVEQGYVHCGPVGSGHFVKMVHNGIEYGLMQAYAEGFDILQNRTLDSLPEAERFHLNLADIAEVWRRGSVVSSWLLDLTAAALAENQTLSNYSGFVEDSGEGRWTVAAALETATPADVLTASLYTRFRSRQVHTFADKLLSAMRFKFGGHVEKKQ